MIFVLINEILCANSNVLSIRIFQEILTEKTLELMAVAAPNVDPCVIFVKFFCIRFGLILRKWLVGLPVSFIFCNVVVI